jgi:hypothetical protein
MMVHIFLGIGKNVKVKHITLREICPITLFSRLISFILDCHITWTWESFWHGIGGEEHCLINTCSHWDECLAY